MTRQKAEIVGIKPDRDRILASIAYVIHVAEGERYRFTQYDIVKALFLADRNHLNRFGRLITTDTYVAMKHGPVPSASYDLLKPNPVAMRRFDLKDLPWSSEKIDDTKFRFYDANISKVDDILSRSDKDAIKAAVTTVSNLSFAQIRKLTHDDPAYIDAWEDDTDKKQFPISLGLLFDTPNFEKAREIRDISKL